MAYQPTLLSPQEQQDRIEFIAKNKQPAEIEKNIHKINVSINDEGSKTQLRNGLIATFGAFAGFLTLLGTGPVAIAGGLALAGALAGGYVSNKIKNNNLEQLRYEKQKYERALDFQQHERVMNSPNSPAASATLSTAAKPSTEFNQGDSATPATQTGQKPADTYGQPIPKN